MNLTCKLNKISGNCFFEGKIFKDNKWLAPSDIASLFHNVTSKDDVLQILKKINGFFYIAVESEHEIFLVTDIVRTYPVFYKVQNDSISIGENAIDLATDCELSIHNTDCFLSCGYTVENNTIFRDIFQVESASIVSITKTDGKATSMTYYNPIKSSFLNSEKEELFSNLDKAYTNVVQKALDYARGRTIVIPLSGGYDSRLIAMTLKRLGAKDVICYAYGTKHIFDTGYAEIKTSREVAKLLGYKWMFIEYSYDKWHKLIQVQDAADYIKYVSRGTSLVSYQDWLAVSELKKRNLVPKDSVFIPGHTGDFITGSAVPVDVDFDKIYHKQEILKHLSERYFNLFPFVSQKSQLKNCTTFIHPDEIYNAEDYVHFIETFSWKEYHSKHICNSAQVYKFYGYDWYFPLWDREIVDLWFSIHPREKRNRALYKEFADSYFNTSIPYVSNTSSKNPFSRVVIKLCKILNAVFLVNNYYGIAKVNKLSLFFEKIPVPDELKKSFVLNNSNQKLRNVSLNGLGALQALLTILPGNQKKSYK